MKRLLLALAVVLVLLLPILFMGALIAIADEDVAPSDKALREIPADLLPLYYSAAATCDGLEWTVLAAIHKLETGFGRGRATSSAGAKGPMQFMSATWRAYAIDGDRDGVANINDIDDAFYSAAHLLCANGAGDPARLADPIWSYNHSHAYVARALELAASYGVVTWGYAMIGAAPSDILNNPEITLTSNARADVEAGIVEPRLLALLDAISRRYTIGVSVFKTGHSKYVKDSDEVSNHFYGRAVDISFVAGVPVTSSNIPARQVVILLAGLQGQVRPDEVGHPFVGLQFSGGFSDFDHRGHIHVGFD